MFRSKAILYLPVLILVSSMGCSPNPEAQSFFGQILIGPDKSESSVRLPLIAAGDSIYVDANDDGKPDDSELLANGSATVVTPENSKSEFSVTAELAIKPELASETLPQRLNIVVNVKGDSEFQMKGSLELAIAPDDNHWLHFGGPMQLHTESEYSVRDGCLLYTSPSPRDRG